MTNKAKYEQAFITSLRVEKGQLQKLTYQSIEAWDSVGHMGLISSVEECFDIVMEMDDIIDFSSYEKGREILAKYGVEF